MNEYRANRPPKEQMMSKVQIVLIVIFMMVLMVCGGILFLDWYDGYKSEKEKEQLASQMQSAAQQITAPMGENDILPAFRSFYQKNKDTAGWIKIDGTPIDYVVVQTDNNDDYLRSAYDGTYNRNGTIFLDYQSKFNPKGKNIVIYGHNMKTQAMFSTLGKYETVKYYQEHPVVEFNTLYEYSKYKIFAVVLMDASPDGSGSGDEFQLYSQFSSDDSFMKYIDKVRAHSLLDIDVSVKKSDKIISLVTCAYDIEDGRYAIFAREIRKDESADVDTSTAKLNEDVIMPGKFTN
ncbi:MAG TPA: class B sortase [Oscillospiraceae bacterium]|nr:class B sortase [Oscillospiraceae bacterium]HPS34703.1 class B sortase [Oscillospiraceae bacterium]